MHAKKFVYILVELSPGIMGEYYGGFAGYEWNCVKKQNLLSLKVRPVHQVG